MPSTITVAYIARRSAMNGGIEIGCVEASELATAKPNVQMSAPQKPPEAQHIFDKVRIQTLVESYFRLFQGQSIRNITLWTMRRRGMSYQKLAALFEISEGRAFQIAADVNTMRKTPAFRNAFYKRYSMQQNRDLHDSDFCGQSWTPQEQEEEIKASYGVTF